MPDSKPRVLLAWSSGKDAAWALRRLRAADAVAVVGLLTTFDERSGRVAMHAVRRELVGRQAAALGLPLRAIPLPFPCPNDRYEAKVRAEVTAAARDGITALAFGDLHLTDVRDYRIRLLAGTGVEPIFPVWGTANEAPEMARAILACGIRATLACVDPRQVPESFLGRSYDADLLADLPARVDPCGERGEFHTFCTASPDFAGPVEIELGGRTARDGFSFVEIVPLRT